MSFALPTAFFLCLLAVPIIVLYIMKVRLRRVPVSTNLFWSQIYDEKPPRSIWQYFKHLLSLLLQLFLLLLLVLALSDPYLPWQLLQARRVAVVIDNSASMQTADVDGQSRFQSAIEQAQQLVDGLRFRDEMTIILAGARPEVVLGMSSHGPTLKRTLRELKVTEYPTDIAAAVELGQQLIGKHPAGEVVVFTDGCLPVASFVEVNADEQHSDRSEAEVKAETDSETKVRYQLVGNNTANVGITQFQVRRSLSDPLGYEVLASVFNASDSPVNCRLELELDGVPIDVLPLKLKPEERWSRSLEKTSIDGGKLVAMLTRIEVPSEEDSPEGPDPDSSIAVQSDAVNGLHVDDRAWAVLPARDIQKVLIVTPGNLFLQKVFEANPLVRIDVQKEFPEQWPANTLIVLHENIPETLPPGDLFMIDPGNNTNAWEVGDVLDNPIVTDMQKDSPLMTHVRLDNVLIPESKKITYTIETSTLAGVLSGDPIYSQLDRPTGKALVLNVSLQNSDLAFRTAFPIMVTNALGWFAGESGELRPSLATGATTELALDRKSLQGESELVITSPDQGENAAIQSIILPDSESSADTELTIPVGPFPKTGVWMLSKASDQTQSLTEVAVNLANERETDLRPLNELKEQASQSVRLAGAFTRPFWFYLIVAACILTTVEWFLYQRRVVS